MTPVTVLNVVNCVSFLCLQRALLYSGVNQLANGRHSGEDSHNNTLKMMQRAVLLCPGINAQYLVLLSLVIFYVFFALIQC